MLPEAPEEEVPAGGGEVGPVWLSFSKGFEGSEVLRLKVLEMFCRCFCCSFLRSLKGFSEVFF